MSTYLSARTIPVDFQNSLYNSDRSYRLIELSNGLFTLLVSQPSKLVGSCGVCVASGSHDDPCEIPGLAHLCEHMLFLGTSDFPKPNEFLETIDTNGGKSNAFTTGEQTCYYFELPITEGEKNEMPLFNYATNCFSSFFKNPIFNECYIKKEIQAVDDEHKANISNLNKIFFHGLKILANERHPFHKFGTGNLNTLGNIPRRKSINMRKCLTNHFAENYCSENMTLVIKGPHSLGQLQKIAVSTFSDVEQRTRKPPKRLSNGSSKSSDFPCQYSGFNILNNAKEGRFSEKVFSNETKGRLLYIKSSQHSNIRLIFPIPSSSNSPYISTIQNIWCSYLGDESHGSLYEHLADSDNFIRSIYVFTQELCINDSVLCIDMELTVIGVRNIHLLVERVLSKMEELIALSQANLISYLAEQIIISKLSYFHQDKYSSCSDEVCQLSQQMQSDLKYIGLTHLLRGNGDVNEEDLQSLSSSFIIETQNVFNTANLNIIFVGRDLQKLPFLHSIPDIERKDPFYNFEFSVYLIILEKLQPSRHIQYGSYEFKNTFLDVTLEAMNHKLSLVRTNAVDNSFQTESISSHCSPKLFQFSTNHEIWFKKELDLSYKEKLITTFQVQSVNKETSPLKSIAMEVLCELLGKELRKNLYRAEQIGYSWSMFPNATGSSSIAFNLAGPSECYGRVLNLVVQQLTRFLSEAIESVSYKDLSKARIKIRKDLEELTVSSLVKQSIAASIVFLEEDIWSLEERTEALEILTLEDLRSSAKALLNDPTYTRIVVSGDISRANVHSLCLTIDQFSRHETKLADNHNPDEPSSKILLKGRNHIHEISNCNNEDPLNATYHYIQIGLRESPLVRALGKLTAYLLSSNCAFELRTLKQLGYTVLAGLRISRSTLGVQFCVLSGSHEPQDVLNEISSFLREWEQRIEEYSEDEFQKKVIEPFALSGASEVDDLPSNLVYLMEPSQSSSNYCSQSDIKDSHRNIWEKVLTSGYRFSGRSGNEAVDIGFVTSLKKDEYLRFYRKYISPSSNKRATISVLIHTQLSSEEIHRNNLKVEICYFLRSIDLNIEEEELNGLLQRCKYDSDAVVHQLYKHFRKNHMGFQFLKSSFPMMALSIIAPILKKTKPEKRRSTPSNSISMPQKHILQSLSLTEVASKPPQTKSIYDKLREFKLNQDFNEYDSDGDFSSILDFYESTDMSTENLFPL